MIIQNQDKCIEGVILVQSTEIEEKFSACIYKNNVVR